MTASPLQLALAEYLDFRPAGDDLTDVFWRRGVSDVNVRLALLRNPTVNSRYVDEWLGVGTKYSRPTKSMLTSILACRALSPAALDLILDRERTHSVLTYLLTTQRLSHEQLFRLLEMLGDSENYTLALAHAEILGIRDNPHAREIVARAGAAGRLFALAYRVLPDEECDTEQWLKEWHPLRDGLWSDAWDVLVQQRPDLYGTLAAYCPTDTSEHSMVDCARTLASSFWLADVAWQRALVDLDVEPRRWRDLSSWLVLHGSTLRALVTNPRCAAEVVTAIAERYEALGKDVPKFVTERLATLSTHPPYDGDLDTESDPNRVAWLATWLHEEFRKGRRAGSPPSNTRVLTSFLANPVLWAALSPVDRTMVAEAHEHVQQSSSWISSDHVLARYDARLRKNAKELKPYLGKTLDGLMVSHVDWSLLTRYCQNALGNVRARYETLLALSENWTGTFASLVTTAKEL